MYRCIYVYISIQHYQHYHLIMLDIYIYISSIISSHNKKLMKNNAPNTEPYKLQIHCFNTSKPRQYIQEQQKDTSRSVITTIRNPTIYKSHKFSQVFLSFKWSIVKRLSAYSDITKKYLLCLHEKLEIVNYPHPEELLNKRSELVSKCRHANKYLLKNYKANH